MSTTSLTRLPVTTTINDNTQFIIQQNNTLTKVLWRTAKNDATKGFSGSRGRDGFTGSGAVAGFTGSRGIPGATGFVGSSGPGRLGYTGSEGPGFTGSQGYTGNDGPRGWTGSQGARGYTGSLNLSSITNDIIPATSNTINIGSSSSYFSRAFVFELRANSITDLSGSPLNIGGGGGGYIGSTGATGYTGSHGYTGSASYTGSRGFIGSQGYTGSIGYTGSPGIGYTGSSAAGFMGSQGDLGYTGSRGNDGTSVAIVGSINSSGDLDPSYGGDIGDGFISQDNGHLWVWNEAGWIDAGEIRGPQGEPGYMGSEGYTGSMGMEGYTGSMGMEGYTGSPGTSLTIAGDANQIQYNDGSGGLTSSSDFVYGRAEDSYGLGLLAGASINFWDSAGVDVVGINAPTSLFSSYTLKLPISQGDADTYLKNDGSGNLSWETVSGGGGGLTYTVSVEQSGVDALLKLTDSDDVTDDITIKAGNNVLISVTDANTIEIAAATGAEAMKNNLSELNDVSITDAVNGQLLQWNGTSWVNAEAPTGGGTGGGITVNARTNIVIETPTLAPNGTSASSIAAPKGYMLYKIQTNRKCWLRLYTGPDAVLADADRPNNIDPLPGSGVIADVTFANDNSTLILAPAVMGWSEEERDEILYRITNLGVGSVPITVTLTVVRLEL